MNIETRDILKAWAAISIAFAIVLSNKDWFAVDWGLFPTMFLISGFTVGVGFLLHELSHRYFAKKYKCKAEFRSFDQMLVLAIIMSFFGFVFAAPGAVFISGRISKKQNGKISAAGPATNIILALVFLGLRFFNFPGIFGMMANYGMMINAWLALFNMIPFGNFDGAKILPWNKVIYGAMVVVSAVLAFVV